MLDVGMRSRAASTCLPAHHKCLSLVRPYQLACRSILAMPSPPDRLAPVESDGDDLAAYPACPYRIALGTSDSASRQAAGGSD